MLVNSSNAKEGALTRMRIVMSKLVRQRRIARRDAQEKQDSAMQEAAQLVRSLTSLKARKQAMRSELSRCKKEKQSMWIDTSIWQRTGQRIRRSELKEYLRRELKKVRNDIGMQTRDLRHNRAVALECDAVLSAAQEDVSMLISRLRRVVRGRRSLYICAPHRMPVTAESVWGCFGGMRRTSGTCEGRTLVTAELTEDYRPSDDEPFMNDRQLEYFRRKLVAWKNDILAESRDTIEALQDSTRNIPDVTDRASEETDRAIELRTRDRQRKLVSKIDSALRRIENGEYGYCEVTGEPISLKRLDARPIATMSLEAQERHERREKVHRDD